MCPALACLSAAGLDAFVCLLSFLVAANVTSTGWHEALLNPETPIFRNVIPTLEI